MNMSLFASEQEKRDFLQIKEDDEPHIRSMKAELLMLMDMTPQEKQLHYAQQAVTQEEHQLQRMIDQNKRDDEFIRHATLQARRCMIDYNALNDDESLAQAELWAEIAKGTKANKYTLADIRKQRERIWQKKNKLRTVQQSEEPSTSSNNSES